MKCRHGWMRLIVWQSGDFYKCFLIKCWQNIQAWCDKIKEINLLENYRVGDIWQFNSFACYVRDKAILGEEIYLSREDSHLFQVVSNSKFVSVGVQSPTEINAPRGCAVILKRMCQLILTRITRQVSRLLDLKYVIQEGMKTDKTFFEIR